MNERKRVLAIVNPRAGSTAWAREIDRIFLILRERGWAIERMDPATAEETTRQGARAHEFDLVLILGGDGTVSRAVQKVIVSEKEPSLFAVLPFGTANVIARDLQLSLDPVSAAHSLLTARPQRLDIGEVSWPDGRTQRFLLSAGLGAIASAVVRVSLGLKRIAGRAAYGWPVLQALASPESIRVRAAGEELTGTMAFATLTRHYAGSFVPDAHADFGDGMMDLYVIKGRFHSFFNLICAGRNGNIAELDEVERRQVDSFEILSSGDFELDGDPAATGPPAVVRVLGKIPFLGMTVRPV